MEEPTITTPLLPKSSNHDIPDKNSHFQSQLQVQTTYERIHSLIPISISTPVKLGQSPYKCLAVISSHVSCIALCGEFIFGASHSKDITVWRQPDLNQFTKFGHGEGSVKSLLAIGDRLFSAHQDGKVRIWKVSRKSENAFRLLASLPTTKDYLERCLKQSNYVQTRRNHKKLWIEHGDSVSCLAVDGAVVYSGSWDRTLKVWRMSDLKCLESIRAHDDAINGLVTQNGIVYSASADGKIKAWGKRNSPLKNNHCLLNILISREGMSWNSIVKCDEMGLGQELLYAGGSDGHVVGWKCEIEKDKRVWKMVCDIKAHDMSVLTLCVVREFVFSGSGDNGIRVWKREKDGGLGRLGFIRGHEGPVRCLQASWYRREKGYVLYSGGLDKSLRVWWVPQQNSEGE